MLRTAVPAKAVLALTATATAATASAIASVLGIEPGDIIRDDSLRPNLRLAVSHYNGGARTCRMPARLPTCRSSENNQTSPFALSDTSNSAELVMSLWQTIMHPPCCRQREWRYQTSYCAHAAAGRRAGGCGLRHRVLHLPGAVQ